jgi:hypothetical protein
VSTSQSARARWVLFFFFSFLFYFISVEVVLHIATSNSNIMYSFAYAFAGQTNITDELFFNVTMFVQCTSQLNFCSTAVLMCLCSVKCFRQHYPPNLRTVVCC